MVDAGPDGGLDTVFIAFTFALRDQQWELPRSILRLNLFSTVRGTRQELQTEVRSPWISHWTLWLSLIRCLDHIPGSLVCSWPFKGLVCPAHTCSAQVSLVMWAPSSTTGQMGSGGCAWGLTRSQPAALLPGNGQSSAGPCFQLCRAAGCGQGARDGSRAS